MPDDLITRISRKVNCAPKESCWNWTGLRNIYGYAVIKRNGKSNCLVHRIMYELFVGNIPDKMMVLHKCDNRRCVNPSHLFLGTQGDNMRDAALKNRMVHKLSFRQVLEIRRLYIEGFTQEEISKMFSINQSNVSRIVSKKRRPHV